MSNLRPELERVPHANQIARLDQDFSHCPAAGAAGGAAGTPFAGVFTGQDYRAFETHLRDEVSPLFAEAKIVNGIGSRKSGTAADLPPTRVSRSGWTDFAETNPLELSTDAPRA